MLKIRSLPIHKYLVVDDIHKDQTKITAVGNSVDLVLSTSQLHSFFLPRIRKSVYLPYAVLEEYISDINIDPKNSILLSGRSINRLYPMRNKLKNFSKKYPITDKTTLAPGKFGIEKSLYMTLLKEYLCVFTCCSTPPTTYIIKKVFEIPASGALLFLHDEYVKDDIEKLHFEDGKNYIGCTEENMEEKIIYILDPNNRTEIDRIRKNGHEMIKKYHTVNTRKKELYKLLNITDT